MKKFWNDVAKAGTMAGQPYVFVMRIRLQNLFSLLVMFFALLFIGLNLINHNDILAIIDVAIVALMGFSIYLNHRKRFLFSSLLFQSVLIASMILLCFFYALRKELEYLFVLTGISPLLFFHQKKIIYGLLGFNFISFIVAKYLAYGLQESIVYLNYVFVFSMFFFVVKYLKDVFETQLAIVESQNVQLKKLNDEKNQLISIASHDLRSPLARIQGLLSLLMLKGPLTLEQSEIIGKAHKEAKQQTEMISEVLDLYAFDEGVKSINLERVNVLAMVNDLVVSYTTLADKKNIGISIEQNTEATHCRANHSYLTQVFENLLSNAIKFSHAHSRITVSIQSIVQAVQISIKDEGQGMDVEDQKKLFLRFQPLSAKPTKGERTSGLGLSIAKKYIEAMNGALYCESEKGKGTTFFVELPIA